jgi:O-antigen/teichoic acid export membrane protein
MALVLLNVGLYKLDILLVSYFMTPADTGHYRAALQVAEFIWVGAVAMELVMIQSTADLWARGDTERVTALLSKLLKYVVAFTALLVVGVFVLGDSFVTVYFGASFHRSVLPLRLLLPGVLGFAIARIIWPVLQAGGHLRGILAATGTAVGLNAVLNVLLIPRFGIVGAAVATSIAYGLMAVFHTLVAHRVSIRPFAGLPVIRIFGIALLTAGALALMDPFAPWYLDLSLLPVVGLVVYVIGLFRAGVLTSTEVRDLLDSSGLATGPQ